VIIQEGSIIDLIFNIEFIKQNIPEKSNLSKNEIYDKIYAKPYGIILALEFNKLKGINVWYEKDNSLYLWLGVMSEKSKGFGYEVLSYINNHTNYSRWFVKTSQENKAALALLNKFDFKEYKKEKNIVYLERLLN
jgi:hypothetical protein